MTTPIDDLHAATTHAPRQRPRFDSTINVPTILMLMCMIAGTITSVISVYARLNDRIMGTANDFAVFRTQTAGDISSLKQQVQQDRMEQQQDREDVKSDLHDINAKLDKLLWDRGDRPNNGGRP